VNKQVIANDNPVPIPQGVNVHYEVELAVIMLRSVHNLRFGKSNMSAEQYEELWKASIFGYAIGELDLCHKAHK